MDFTDEQLEELISIFRSEATEHLKSMTNIFLGLEKDGADAAGESLVKAFREAHSLKGSAATLGFYRVEQLTHALEDRLGQLRDRGLDAGAQEIDLLLEAVDVVVSAAARSVPGDRELEPEERKLLARLGAADGEAPEEKRSDPAPAPPTESSPPEGDPGAAQDLRRGGVLRIQESKVDAVIARVSELFEANLALEAIKPELRRFSARTEEISRMVDTLAVSLDETQHGPAIRLLGDRARNLSYQLQSVEKRFDADQHHLSKLVQGTQDELGKVRLAPVSTVFIQIRRQVREIAKAAGKRIELALEGGEYAVDRKVLDAVEEPLIHILRNAASHGIESAEERREAGKPETGKISVSARHTGDAVEITVEDDGRGIDHEKIREAIVIHELMPESQAANLSRDQLTDHLFESGFSTASDVSAISGRGVGLDVVKFAVERLGGEVRLTSEPGRGTSFSLRLPLAMSTVRCLLVRVADRVLAIPASNVEKVIIPGPDDIRTVGGARVLIYRDENVPHGSLADLLELTSPTEQSRDDESRAVVVIAFGERRFAFDVDDLVEYSQLILKPLGDLLERVPNISGLSLLGTGEIALVLNPSDLVRAAGGLGAHASRRVVSGAGEERHTARVLVVDDSIATRTLEKTLLESAGFTVALASDGLKALDVISGQPIDVVVSDIQMPNMDGIELARTIKSRPLTSHLPVILVTSLGSDEDKARGMAAGADAYIVKKELTQGELVDTIRQLV